jgi:hypothetical protein
MAINASSGGQLQGGSSGSGGSGLTEEDVQDIVAEQIEVGNDINIGLQTSYDDVTGKLKISLSGAGGGMGGGNTSGISVQENATGRGTATTLNFVGPNVSVENNIATITGGLDSVSIYENASNRGNLTSINFVSGATVNVIDGTANIVIDPATGYMTAIQVGNAITAATASLASTAYVATQIASIPPVDLTSYATKTFVNTQINSVLDGAPAALDTLKEIATALGNNATFADTIAASVATKASQSYVDTQLATKVSQYDLSVATAATSSTLTNYVNSALASYVAYTLPLATASTLGGVKVGSGLAIDSQGVLTATGTSIVSLPWGSITDKPAFATIATTGNYTDLTNKPSFSTVATSGNYSDLSGKPTIPADISQLTDTTNLLGGGSSSGIDLTALSTYLTTNGYATQVYVTGQIDNLVNGAPGILNTLQELATAINNDANFASSITNGLAGKLNVSGGTMTGALTLSGAPTTALHAATKAYVDNQITAGLSSIGTGASSVAQLTDVNLTGITAGKILAYDGSMWVPVNNSGAKGDKGDTGNTGPIGLSISAATVTLAGRLQLTLSDNTVVDAGNVSGIKSATVNGSGELILTKQDNTTINAGSVIGPKGDKGNTGDKGDTGDTGIQGPAGLAVTNAAVNGSGRLIVTRSDSSIIDAGYVIGPKGDKGNTGDKGDTGNTGTVEIGTVTTGAAGGSASVTNSGTSTAATLNFSIPQGAKGDTGTAATIAVGSVTTGAAGSAASVANSGTASAATLNFSIPQGAKGDTGNAGVGISSATVNGSGNLIITKTDSSTVDVGSVVGSKGDKGDTGNAGTIAVNAVATGAEGTDVIITNTGTASSALLNFTIPKGDTGLGVFSAVVNSEGNLIVTLTDASTIDAGSTIGPQGPQGSKGDTGLSITSGSISGDNLVLTKSDSSTINVGNVRGPKGDTGSQGNAGTISVGSVTTGAAGSSVAVTNTGTSSAATLNFAIPQGAKGDTGTSYTVNGKTGTVQVYGLGNTTQPGYDLEVDVANKANKWTTARTLTLSGKITGLTSFDGSGNITMTTALNAVTTSDITEGSRLYYTDSRARLALSSVSDSNITSLISYDEATGQIKYRANTSYITEGSNLFFTNTRADTRADTRIAASSINALSDVDTITAAPTNGQVLTWTGSAWTPSTVAGGSGAVSSVNAKTGIVVLNTDDVSEGSTNSYFTNTRWDNRLAAKTTDNLNQGATNKYFSDALARNALAAGTGLSYNSASGTFSLSTSTSNVTEGSNLYFTNARFDTRLGQSNLNAFADVADTTPTTGQSLAWNGSAWAPTTISSGGGGGGGSSSGIFRAGVQVEYDASGALTGVSVLSGGISAVVTTATSTVATVTFTFTGSACAPLGIQIYGYQRASNVYVTRAVSSDYTTRTVAGGGSSGAPSAFSAFDPSVNTLTLSLTKALTGATAAVGQTTHCVVQFLLSNI